MTRVVGEAGIEDVADARVSDEPLDDRAGSRGRSGVQLAAALLAAAPMVALALWMYVVRDGPMTLKEMLGGPLIVGGAMIGAMGSLLSLRRYMAV